MLSRKFAVGMSVAGVACVLAYGCGGGDNGNGPGDGGQDGSLDQKADVKKEAAAMDNFVGDDTSGDDSGGTCPSTGYTALNWLPPSMWGQGACTPAQLSSYYADCFMMGGSACDGFVQAMANAACIQCIIPDLGMMMPTAEGPVIAVILPNNTYIPVPNYGGCTAHMDGKTAAGSCGDKIQDDQDCVAEDCSGCMSSGAFTTCEGQAQMGECKKYIDATCDKEIQDGGVAGAACNDIPTILAEWCGGGDGGGGDAGDAGDDGGDSSTDAASEASDAGGG
jgi:hypothetical protein